MAATQILALAGATSLRARRRLAPRTLTVSPQKNSRSALSRRFDRNHAPVPGRALFCFEFLPCRQRPAISFGWNLFERSTEAPDRKAHRRESIRRTASGAGLRFFRPAFPY